MACLHKTHKFGDVRKYFGTNFGLVRCPLLKYLGKKIAKIFQQRHGCRKTVILEEWSKLSSAISQTFGKSVRRTNKIVKMLPIRKQFKIVYEYFSKQFNSSKLLKQI